ncbi:hypothetical protein, partial [Rhizobium leguminosarum]|uniref:hypothetical protein n=1 Tax=Rhizobium leguminosarum TaxID=384 RepID=UPI00197D15B3
PLCRGVCSGARPNMRCGPMMPPDLNPPTNEKGYITGPDKTPHIAATTARVFAVDATPADSAQSITEAL